MYQGKKIIGIIPARGGSKGVKKKNIKMLAGKPLLAWTGEAALKSKYLDRVILTSDNDEIINVAKELNIDIPFKRPRELALDETPGITPILHALEKCPGFDYAVILQVTSPARTVDDIDACIELLLNAPSKDTLASVCSVNKPPQWMFYLDKYQQMTSFMSSKSSLTHRQQANNLVVLNGAIYVLDIISLKKKQNISYENALAYFMPEKSSIDIDSEFDFTVAEIILNDNNAS